MRFGSSLPDCFSSMETIAYSLPCVTSSGFLEMTGHLHLPNKPWKVYLGSSKSCSSDDRYLHTWVFRNCSSSFIFYINRNWHDFAILQWHHNERDDVSNHRRRGCLLSHLFRRTSKKISELRLTCLCEGNPPVTGDSLHKLRVTRKMFPFDNVIMIYDSSHFLWFIAVVINLTNDNLLREIVNDWFYFIFIQLCKPMIASPYDHFL